MTDTPTPLDLDALAALAERLRVAPTIRIPAAEHVGGSLELASAIRQMMIDRAEAATALTALQSELQAKDRALERMRAGLTPFAEPHLMGDNYVQFAPRLLQAARAALAEKETGG